MPGSYNPVAVIIPALDEEEALPRVLAELPGEWTTRVVVVDNGSSDRTAEVARRAGAEVVTEPRRGYGRACLAGMAALADDPPAIVTFLDADHSDHAEELPLLLAPIESGEADLVIGSRLRGCPDPGALPLHARLGNRLATWLIRALYGTRFTDLGPFRAIRWESLAGLGMIDTGFGWTVEMQVKAARAGLRCREVPVRYRRRIGQSKISGTLSGSVRAGARILWTVFRHAGAV